MFLYIEIKSFENGEVIKRIDCSGHGTKQMEQAENGINRNLNHEKYYTFSFESETKLDEI